MDNQTKKCSFKEHKNIDAVIYCRECNIYICNKCLNTHNGFFDNHHHYNLDDNINEIFTGICNEENHLGKLVYFCKNHNKLCCASCITKIKGEGNGQHSDCNICFIKEIEYEKKNKLKQNIICLEKLSNDIEKTINEIKVNFEKMNQNKENLKEKIQNIFTKIRQVLNEREDELLLEIDEKYSHLYSNENIIKESKNLPYKINASLKNGKIIDKDWNDNQLNLMINICINIENNIKDINNLFESFKKYNIKKEIKFSPDEGELKTFVESIKSFGNIWINNYSSLYIRENKKCIVMKFGGNNGCFGKLVGYRFSPTVQEVLHVVELTKAPIELLNVDWDDQEASKILVTKSPTRTFPFLEIEEGVLSESQTIEEYLATKYKVELLGQSEMQKAKVRQWVDFASFELEYCAKEIIHPILGWKQYCKESADQANSKLKEFMKTLENQLNKKKYILGDKLTLADVSLFRHLKLFFQLVFHKGLRKRVFPKVSTWFSIVSQTPEVQKVYGKVLLCKIPIKALTQRNKSEKEMTTKKFIH